MTRVRPAAVAGTFYPAGKETLAAGVRTLMTSARPDARGGFPKALIVPHAGYVYSGAAAAAAYAALQPVADRISRVVLLGPAHRVPLRGVAMPSADAFETPLGRVEIDREALQNLSDLPQVCISDDAHAAEHSLEVQLPFLQTILAKFKLVPLVVGQASSTAVAQVLERLWGGRETLILISSDLSHFLDYQQASEIDRQTVNTILALAELQDFRQACGATPINGLVLAAKQHHLRPSLIAMCNSGDTAGDRRRVVGYASIAFVEGEQGD